MSSVITVENLGKKYLLKHQTGQQPYVALRDVLSDGVKTLGSRLFGRSTLVSRSEEQEEFWALRDVSFEVKQGDRIGIIGRNGAGKSTLLKILSRITEPTTGSVRIKGRVASLLEVGTGFHPELTGRENIYLNGAILGMGRAEIKKKFDEIVDFAEIEKFLDTPVKRYSSGMYVRLAFAVAAHLEPEILVVDEVLAVGDAQFQKKCLGRMEEVSNEGRTVLFVSHSLESIKFLCTTGILLGEGKNICVGKIKEVVKKYETDILTNLALQSNKDGVIYNNYNVNTDGFELIEVAICDTNNVNLLQIKTFDSFKFKIIFNSPHKYESRSATLSIMDLSGTILLRLAMSPYSLFTMKCHKGLNEIYCVVDKIPLPAGTYLINFGISDEGGWIYDKDVCLFEVKMNDIFNCGYPPVEKHAVAVVKYYWEQNS
jgi:lipopolysaccharide transport system ATP-binding protein